MLDRKKCEKFGVGGFGRISLGNTGNFTNAKVKRFKQVLCEHKLYLKWEVGVNFGGVLGQVEEGDYT